MGQMPSMCVRMIIELGHFCLILAFGLSCVQTVSGLVGAHYRWAGWMVVTGQAALLQFALTACAFAALTYAFVTSDFSLRLVVLNSHSLKPMLYKISGVWGNHEGSILRWLWVMAFFGFIFSKHKIKDLDLKSIILAIQGALCLSLIHI